MISVFDDAAAQYDETFTDTKIGRLQRKAVYRHLSKILAENKTKSVLEINCGTGEDAFWLADHGVNVTATDISEQMISVAKTKSAADNPRFKQADINTLEQHFSGEKFDMIFSNFGGLNCLNSSELQKFFENSTSLLSDSGMLVLVIMPKSTLWEKLYFLSKGNFKNMSRRKSGSAWANVGNQKVMTYYYNPEEIVTFASANFKSGILKPIGFFVPPSYLEPYFSKRQRAISMLGKLDESFESRLAAKYADHYLITFKKK